MFKVIAIMIDAIGLICKGIGFLIKSVLPILKDVIQISKKISESGLENEEARKQVFQEVTDFIQARGIAKDYPDAVLNSVIESIYLFYVWKKDTKSSQEQKEEKK